VKTRTAGKTSGGKRKTKPKPNKGKIEGEFP